MRMVQPSLSSQTPAGLAKAGAAAAKRMSAIVASTGFIGRYSSRANKGRNNSPSPLATQRFVLWVTDPASRHRRPLRQSRPLADPFRYNRGARKKALRMGIVEVFGHGAGNVEVEHLQQMPVGAESVDPEAEVVIGVVGVADKPCVAILGEDHFRADDHGPSGHS